MLIFLITFCVVVVVLVGWYVIGGIIISPGLSTPRKIFDQIKKNICMGCDVCLLDLGCGDATTLRRYANSGIKKLVGYEINPLKFYQGKFLNWWRGYQKISLKQKNIFSGSLHGFDYVHCYLLPSIMEKLEDDILDRIDHNTVIIAVSFPFPTLKPFKVIKDNLGKDIIFFYKK